MAKLISVKPQKNSENHDSAIDQNSNQTSSSVVRPTVTPANGVSSTNCDVITRKKALFALIIEGTLVHEGGLANHSKDPGGLTKYGISKRSYPNVNIAQLTLEQAKNIYYKDFWSPYLYYLVADLRVAGKIFDITVNCGAKKAHQIVRRALIAAGLQHIAEDGKFDTVIVEAVNSCAPGTILAALRSETAGHYRLLAAVKNMQCFLAGWRKRAYS